MFEPISVVGFGFTALYTLARTGSAISPEALSVQQAASSVLCSVERSQALFGEKANAISKLWALANECSEPSWDGENAEPLDRLAVFNAQAFIRALPDQVPLPEFSPEPDGAISLDWIRSRNRLFSLSIGSSHRLAYAWLDGTDVGHAVAGFHDGRVPQRILDGISAVFSDGTATFRP